MRIAESPVAFKTLFAAMTVASTFSTRLSGWLAARIWFTPWSVDPGERGRRRQAGWLAGSEPIRFATSAGPITGFVAGYGPTVLVIHGWGDRAASMGPFITPFVEAGYRVIGIDMPGHGNSVSTQPNAYVMADVIREVAQSVDDVRAVVAHSFGAHATMVALRGGLDVASVVMISPSSRLGRTFSTFVELLAVPRRAEQGLVRLLEKRFGESLWEDLAGCNLVRDVGVPALIVHDHDDPQVPFEDSESLVGSWPGARLMATTSLGHARILRDEHVLEQAVRFVEDHKRSPLGKELEHAIG